MPRYKLKIENREYTDVSVVDAYTLKSKPVPQNLDPIKHKMFNQDIFEIFETETKTIVNVLHSCARSMKVVPGVLVLHDNKTFVKDSNLYVWHRIIKKSIKVNSY